MHSFNKIKSNHFVGFDLTILVCCNHFCITVFHKNNKCDTQYTSSNYNTYIYRSRKLMMIVHGSFVSTIEITYHNNLLYFRKLSQIRHPCMTNL